MYALQMISKAHTKQILFQRTEYYIGYICSLFQTINSFTKKWNNNNNIKYKTDTHEKKEEKSIKENIHNVLFFLHTTNIRRRHGKLFFFKFFYFNMLFVGLRSVWQTEK